MNCAPFVILLCTLPSSVHALAVLPVLENGHPRDCSPVPICAFSYDVRDVRDAELDLRQNLSSNGVVVATPLAPILLSDGGFFLRGKDIAIDNAVSPLLTTYFGETNTSTLLPSPYVFIGFTHEGTSYGYYGPTSSNATFAHREAFIPYSDGERGISYDRIVPADPGTSSTDAQIAGSTAACDEVPMDVAPQCFSWLTEANDAASSAVPNVSYGLTWNEAGVAESADAFTPGTSGVDNRRKERSAMLASQSAQSAPRLAPAHSGPSRLAGPTAGETIFNEPAVGPHHREREDPPTRVAEVEPIPKQDLREGTVSAAAGAFALSVILKLLYARIRSRQEALALASRQRLVDILAAQGPLTVTDLARQMSVDRSTALYHIRILRRSSSVHIAQLGRLVYVLLPGQTPPSVPPSFRDAAEGVVLAALRAAGGALPRSDLHARASAVPVRQRNEVLRDLTERGLVERAFVGNAEVVRLAPAASR